MKTIPYFILIILLCACKKTNIEKSIALIEYENVNKLRPNVNLHKDKDVEIFVTRDKNQLVYSCIIYRIDNGELKGYQVHNVELNTYDKANYQWINDSTITFTLSNEYRNSKIFKVTGYDDTTGLDWD